MGTRRHPKSPRPGSERNPLIAIETQPCCFLRGRSIRGTAWQVCAVKPAGKGTPIKDTLKCRRSPPLLTPRTKLFRRSGGFFIGLASSGVPSTLRFLGMNNNTASALFAYQKITTNTGAGASPLLPSCGGWFEDADNRFYFIPECHEQGSPSAPFRNRSPRPPSTMSFAVLSRMNYEIPRPGS